MTTIHTTTTTIHTANQQQLHTTQLKTSNKTYETNWNTTYPKGKNAQVREYCHNYPVMNPTFDKKYSCLRCIMFRHPGGKALWNSATNQSYCVPLIHHLRACNLHHSFHCCHPSPVMLIALIHSVKLLLCHMMGRDSSDDIGTRYGLDGPGIESRWWVRFAAPVHTGPGAHTAS
jgi:hypothetical protein